MKAVLVSVAFGLAIADASACIMREPPAKIVWQIFEVTLTDGEERGGIKMLTPEYPTKEACEAAKLSMPPLPEDTSDISHVYSHERKCVPVGKEK